MFQKRYSMSVKVLAALILSAALASSAAADAFQFMDINFDNDTVGALPTYGASPAPTPGNPIVKPGAFGGYTAASANAFAPPTADCGTIVVGDAAGLTKAAVLTTNAANGALGALWMDTGFSVLGQQVKLEFDVAVLAAPADATVQPKFLNDTADQAGILLGMNAYTSNGWAFRFALAPTGAAGGVFAMRSADNARLITFGSYQNGESHRVALVADYGAGTVDAYLDGVLALDDHPFWTAGAQNVATSEFFYHLNGEAGFASQVAIDNVSASTVPEPAAWTLAATALLAGLALIRRRASR